MNTYVKQCVLIVGMLSVFVFHISHAQTITQSATASFDVLWEVTDGYTPPLYKGKVIPVAESSIHVVALPDPIVTPSGLLYTWEQDLKQIPRANGLGKQSFVFTNSYLDKVTTVKVQATTLSGSFVGVDSVVITPKTPELYIYEKKDGYGVQYAKEVKNDSIFDQSIVRLIAEPYFISTKSLLAEDLEMNWIVNGAQLARQPRINQLNLERTNAGRINLGVFVNKSNKLLQEGTYNFGILFK